MNTTQDRQVHDRMARPRPDQSTGCLALDEPRHEPLECRRRIATSGPCGPPMAGPWCCWARRSSGSAPPVRQGRERSRIGVAGAQPGDEVEVGRDAAEVRGRAPSAAAVGSSRSTARARNRSRATQQHDARVEPLAALDVGHDAQDRRTGTGRAQASERAAARSRPTRRWPDADSADRRSALGRREERSRLLQPARPRYSHEPARAGPAASRPGLGKDASRAAPRPASAPAVRRPRQGSRHRAAARGRRPGGTGGGRGRPVRATCAGHTARRRGR